MNELSAPEIDGLLRMFEQKNFNPESYDEELKQKISVLYGMLDKIESTKEDDDLKILYFSAPRGNIEDYGDYEELKEYGDVSSYEEFEKNFHEDYPDDMYWYRMVTSKYESYRAISINYKNIIYTDLNSESTCFENRQLQKLLDFIICKVDECIKMLENNTYNDYVSQNLSYNNRFGVIKRSDYWKLYPDVKKNLLEDISQEEIDEFIRSTSENIEDRIKNMTSGKYFECVRLAYQNNMYDIGNLNDRELYLKYADGRDEGLSEINPDSNDEFDKWYNRKDRYGGHPWEIMKGHSFYRVNLQVLHDEKGYYLSLNGDIILRKIELAKIYLILKENDIPVNIYNVDVIKKAFSGEDYIGIVPNDIIPIRCESYFKKYNPREFIHLTDEKILDYAIWEDIEKAYLK